MTGSAEVAPPVGADDHARGPAGAPSVVLYGDATCPRCQATVRVLRGAPLRVGWRHLVLRARGPRPRALALALEAAAAQGAFWALLDRVVDEPGRTEDPDLWAHARALGLDVGRFDADRRADAAADVVGRHLAEALRAGATGTPALLVGGRVEHGVPDAAWVAAVAGA